MALTINKVADFPLRDRRLHIRTVDFDSSYATGGEALSKNDLGFAATVDPEFRVVPLHTAGFFFEYDHANAKLKALAAIRVFTATFDPASLAGVTSRDDAITFTGVLATDVVVAVIPPAAILASVVVQNARVTGADTVTVRLTNPSAGAVDVVSGTWTAIVASANGAAKEVANAVDLSGLTGVTVMAFGKYQL